MAKINWALIIINSSAIFEVESFWYIPCRTFDHFLSLSLEINLSHSYFIHSTTVFGCMSSALQENMWTILHLIQRASRLWVLSAHSKRSYVVQWTYESVSIPNIYTQSYTYTYTSTQSSIHLYIHSQPIQMKCIYVYILVVLDSRWTMVFTSTLLLYCVRSFICVCIHYMEFQYVHKFTAKHRIYFVNHFIHINYIQLLVK